jgi:hypothetical protein
MVSGGMRPRSGRRTHCEINQEPDRERHEDGGGGHRERVGLPGKDKPGHKADRPDDPDEDLSRSGHREATSRLPARRRGRTRHPW